MRIIWAVSSGEYSDYSVGLLFTTKELATEHAERMNARERYGDYRVEEFELWDSRPPTYVVHYRQGKVYADGVREVRSWQVEHVGQPNPEERMSVSGPSAPNNWFSVTSTDPERLDKVWGERVAKLQAELADL